MTAVPYEHVNTTSARAEISKILQRFGCEAVGFMDNYVGGEVKLAFRHRGRDVELVASAKGWAAMYLKAHKPTRNRSTAQLQKEAIEQGLRAVNSILRDWIKGQVTAVECGVLSFDGIFLPYMILPDGRSVLEATGTAKLLPPPMEGRP